MDGGPFTAVHTITNAASDNAYRFYDLALSGVSMTSNVRIEFDSNISSGEFFVDDVEMLGGGGPAPSQPPIANASPNQSAADDDGNGSEAVTLNGSAYSDPDGPIVSYQWREGSMLLGTGSTLAVTLGAGAHIVTLTVADSQGLTASDTAVITVTPNQAPVAVAGPDQAVNDSDFSGSESVTVNGSGSSDTDGTIASFAWREGTVALGNGAVLTRAFAAGTHTVTLTVTDNGGATASDTIVITVSANRAPVANAGPDQTILDANNDGTEVVTFNGSGSTDPDGTIASYSWRKNGNFFGNTATFSVIQAIGVHTVELTVTDDNGATSTDTVVVTVVRPAPPPGNVLPVANAGPDQTVTDTDGDGIASVVLNGTASSDPDGSISGYDWWEGPTLIGASFVTGIPLSVGVHTITLVVWDNAGASSSDTVVITVNQGGGSPPPPQGVVTLGGPSSVNRGAQASFTVTVTNTGAAPLTNVQLTFGVSPTGRLKDLSPDGSVSIGTVAPGASVSRTWTGRGDREGSATVTAEALSGGVRLGTAAQALTIRR